MQDNDAQARAMHNEAVALFRAGQLEAACNAFVAAIRVAGEERADPRTLKALWRAARDADNWQLALAAGIRGARRDPLDFEFVSAVVRSLHECPADALIDDPADLPVRLPARPPSLSVIIVSQDDLRYASVDAQFDRAFGNWPHERIRIKGAASMYDGYARGFAQSTGEIVVFSHDDIRFGVPDFAARLADVMESADIAGIAGTTKVSGPALLWSGHPHLHGAVTHKARDDEAYEFAVTSLAGPRVTHAQGLDGVFLAARREWVERIGFDVRGIPGFHFYDLDFSYRGFLAGARVVIACDLGLVHQSRGTFDVGWETAQIAFRRKFARLDAPAAKHRHWYAILLPDLPAVTLHYAKLGAAWKLALHSTDER